MSRGYGDRGLQLLSFPRVSGDEPFGFTVPLRWDPFSPRERG